MSETPGEVFQHIPVLVDEAMEWLGPALQDQGPLVDCTVGGGGHAEAFLERFPKLHVLGLDRDDEAVAAARLRLAAYGARARVVKSNFDEINKVLAVHRYEKVGAVFYDLGVSSVQLDRPRRGFQYRSGAPLDMRMDRRQTLEARTVVNHYSETELIDLLRAYGQERFALRIARAIVARRQQRPFEDAGDLADVVKNAIPAATRRTGPHPARRTFQALRMEVNQELESLQSSLATAIGLLREGGRIAAISYHSGEDSIVKRTFTEGAKGCICPRDLPVCVCGRHAVLQVLTRKAIRPSESEISANPRSDSARMRVAQKLEAIL